MKVMKDGDYQGGNNWATTVLNDHNKYRQQKGLGSVKLDPYLNQKAQARAEYVAKTGEFKHPRGGQKYKDGSPVLENLYQGKGIKNGRQLGTANAPTREWLTSSGHKARLDDKVVTKLGVGNAVGANGVKYTVGLYHPNTPNVRG